MCREYPFFVYSYIHILAGHTADWEEVEYAVADYIGKHGLPETDSHDMLTGDELDEYLEDYGLSFDDYAVIVEL